MTSWFSRAPSRAALPSAWAFNGPTSNNSRGSTSLTSAATNVAGKKVQRHEDTFENWQVEAWEMYRQVGELRYVSNAIAGRMGAAELYTEVAGKRVPDADEDPILALLTPQMVTRAGLNVFIAGKCYLAGLPTEGGKPITTEDRIDAITPEVDAPAVEWMILSALEVKKTGSKRKGQKYEIRGVVYEEDDIYLEKIWDPDPAIWEDSDSPVRSALPVLRELVGLTQHVSAQIDSRLAGAGVYWVPNSILNSAKVPEVAEGQTTFSDNPVLNAIMTGMLLPMEDRSNAAALVPLLMGAPDEAIAKIRFDTFATPFDANTKDLREEAIRRLGLNLDAPPELLQGMGDANHWGMWLVRDEVIQAHVVPRLNLLTDAFTTGFYRVVLAQVQKNSPDSLPDMLRTADPEDVDVKADVSGLVQRPNRLADASQLHAVSAVGDKTLREAGGFDETDAPSTQERAIAIAIQVATANPQLLDNMSEIVTTVKALLDGSPDTGPGSVQSQRIEGTLKPLVPSNEGTPQAVHAAPNGQPSKQAAPLTEADAQPNVAAAGMSTKRTLQQTLDLMRENDPLRPLMELMKERESVG